MSRLHTTIGLLLALSTSPTMAADLTGTFVGASNHVTTGSVEVLKTNDGYQIVLGDDFSLDGAPDPRLGFGSYGAYDDSTTFAILENLTGAQTYALPASIDPTVHNEFYIWCEKFAVPLGIAQLD